MTPARILTAIVAAGALAAVLAYLASGVRVLADPEDLRAFYCAGKVVALRQDPYLTEPLRSCEVRETRAMGLAPYARLALPAPLPGFALVPFALLSLLPFATVSALFVLLLLAALSETALLVRKLAAVPLAGIFVALMLSDGWISLLNGQIVPFALLALCASAVAISRGNAPRASAYALLASIEPHIALPACLALAYAFPKTRLPLALGAAALAVVSLLAIGPQANLEYALAVLPAHAHSEISSGRQYSLTTLLFRSGAPASVATLFGNLSYALLCVLGIAAGKRLSRSLESPELLVLLPPAFALLGGPFVHLTQVAIAIPAIIVLSVRLPGQRAALGIALTLVALPWEDLSENSLGLVLGLVAIVTLALAVLVWRAKPLAAGLTLAAMLTLGAVVKAYAAEFTGPRVDAAAALAAVPAGDHDLAETSWQTFVSATQGEDSRLYFARHLPTWAGLGLMVAITLNAAWRRGGAGPAPSP